MATRDNVGGGKELKIYKETLPALASAGTYSFTLPFEPIAFKVNLAWGGGNFTGTYCDGSYYCSNITMVGLVSRTDNTFSFTTNQKNGIPSIIAYGYE